LLTASLVFVLSGGSSFSGGKLILIGIGIGSMMTSFIAFLMLKASQWDVAAALRWLSGSLNGAQMSNIPALAAALVIFGAAIITLDGRLRTMELGDETAVSLGIPVQRTRLLLIICATGLIAVATAVTGPISFVAFLSGPIASRMTGSGRAGPVPSALTGAALVLAADILGQFAFGTRFPAGVITGMLGAPYLIFLLVRFNRKGRSI
jgi:iron complex transport system permease protein